MSDGGKHISSTRCCKPPDLKEGERCPLEETLGVTNFSMELLWSEIDCTSYRQSNKGSSIMTKHTHAHAEAHAEVLL